jgi:hypothetical protein
MTNKLINLIERAASDDANCLFFGHPHEKFEDRDRKQITVSTKKSLECFSFIFNFLDKKFEEDETLNDTYDELIQNVLCQSLTYVNAEHIASNLQDVIEQLLVESKELQKQTDTAVFKIPVLSIFPASLKHNFCASFISNNIKNEKFLIVTNNKDLIKLYEKI